MKIGKLSLILGITNLLAIGSIYSRELKSNNKLYTPTVKVDQLINYEDDDSFNLMGQAITEQLSAFKRSSPSRYYKYIKFGSVTYYSDILERSLLRFKLGMDEYQNCLIVQNKNQCLDTFNKFINDNFDLYMPKERANNYTKFTAYYSPDIEASFKQNSEYKNPIYLMPNAKDLVLSRNQIDYQGALKNKNLEIAYTKNSTFDLYLMHIEGGGRLIFRDQGKISYKYLSYSGSNKHPLIYVSKHLLSKGYLDKGQLSIRSQRKFIESNPALEEEIMSSNPSYSFFKITDTEPHGIDLIPLTSNRSVAIDRKIYKLSGYLHYIKGKKPYINDEGNVDFKEFSHFKIAQDTGGGIRGPGRMDIYFGFGQDAELAANYVNFEGANYFLVLKKPVYNKIRGLRKK